MIFKGKLKEITFQLTYHKAEEEEFVEVRKRRRYRRPWHCYQARVQWLSARVVAVHQQQHCCYCGEMSAEESEREREQRQKHPR
jgi:hypothetical protein